MTQPPADAPAHPDGRDLPHPVVWSILYTPFGAMSGFVTVALTFLATRHGLSITEGSLLNGAQMISQWLKWLWAPIVDVTLSPKRWYVFSTIASALGVFLMAVIPLGPDTLPLLLLVIAVASLINSMVGMSIEAIMAAVTPTSQQGRVSAWFQAGNLGGAGIGGGLGLLMLQNFPEPWMAGSVMAAAFLACIGALGFLPDVRAHVHILGPLNAVRTVVRDLWAMLKTRGGFLSALLCILPVGTGAAQGTLTQAAVAAYWGAGENEVALLQGVLSGVITAIGCFFGGWLCDRFHPRSAYAGIGLGLAAVATAMALAPATVAMYVVWSMTYSFGVGLAYAAFTAVVLNAIGAGSAATKYSLFASLSNFPIWWLGLLLGRVADISGAAAMLLTEAGLGVLGVTIFVAATRFSGSRTAAAA